MLAIYAIYHIVKGLMAGKFEFNYIMKEELEWSKDPGGFILTLFINLVLLSIFLYLAYQKYIQVWG